MENAQFLMEGALVLLLGATLFHAVRLERALGVLKRDRAVLEALVSGFNESTRAAEAGIERLRGATDGAGRQIARQIEQAQRLRDDLGFLSERGERVAERLEGGVRSARMHADQQAVSFGVSGGGAGAVSGAASAGGSVHYGARAGERLPAAAAEAEGGGPVYAAPEPAAGPRLRSEAGRDLLRALRAAR